MSDNQKEKIVNTIKMLKKQLDKFKMMCQNLPMIIIVYFYILLEVNLKSCSQIN